MGKGFDTHKTRDLDQLQQTGFLARERLRDHSKWPEVLQPWKRFSASLFFFGGGVFFTGPFCSSFLEGIPKENHAYFQLDLHVLGLIQELITV
jgi:hypothetical protein